MTRREFPKSVRVAVIKRATIGNVVYCEACGLPAKAFQIDHVRPDALLGEPILANAQLICASCFGFKNPADTKAVAKAKRREALHLGATVKAARPIKSAGFAKTEKPKHVLRASLPPRKLYREI